MGLNRLICIIKVLSVLIKNAATSQYFPGQIPMWAGLTLNFKYDIFLILLSLSFWIEEGSDSANSETCSNSFTWR